MTEAWLDRARELAPIVAQYRDESERERRLPAPVFEAMRSAGLYDVFLPEPGSAALGLAAAAQLIEEVSRLDGATGWNLCIGIIHTLLGEYLPLSGAAAVFRRGSAVVAGSFAVRGEAKPEGKGYRITGRWPFASGSANANWFMGGCKVDVDGSSGPLLVFFPASDGRVIDTWRTSGMRGTGSNDIEVTDVFVRGDRCFALGAFGRGPGADSAHSRPFFDIAGPFLASIALGIARDAIEAFEALAPGKTPTRSASTLNGRHTAQQKLGQAEGLLRSARAALYEQLERLESDEVNSAELTNSVRLAAASATERAVQVVGLMYDLGGGTSIYETSRLERCFRDVNVVSHHVLVSANNYETVGAHLLSTPLPDGPPAPPADEWLIKVCELEPIVAQYRDESERERHLPAPVFAAMQERRLFSMMVSKAFGGSQVSLETAVRAVEQMSQYDGAAGWNLVIGAGGALMADYLPEEHVPTTFGDWANAGSFGGNGTAEVVEGGYRVTGRWGFASGCHNATFFAGGCWIIDNGAPRMLPNGAPDIQIMMLPASECRIIDTWTSAGLRGTGSHDFEAQEVFVPLGRHVSFFGMREPAPKRASRGYATNFFAMQGPLLSAVALGVARDAIESFRELATAKMPRGGSMTLAQQPTVQDAVARAEALVRSARALVYEAARASDALTDPTPEQATELSAAMRLAGAQAAASAVQAVDLIYDWAGTSSVYATSRIERCFRDVHVVSHHISIASVSFEMVGQYLLGGALAQRR